MVVFHQSRQFLAGSLSAYGLVLLLSILMTGCALTQDSAPSTVSAGTRENGILIMTNTDKNSTAELRVGERLKVSLPENPSTGYTWAIDETDSRLLVLEGTAYTDPTEGFVGARGQRSFTFMARQPGEVVLKMKYWRFWDGDGSITERYTASLRIVP